MSCSNYNFTINQGATLSKAMVYYMPDEVTPFNLTGYTARMQIRPSVASSVILATLTTENGGITLGGTAGTIVLTMSAAATAVLNFDVAAYDMEIVSGGGVVTRLLGGNVTLCKEVTR
jgi:hypothetical protein